MKSLICLILSVACARLMVPSAGAAAPFATISNVLFETRIQGSNSLADFQTIITPANFFWMGFQTTNELSQATNADPVLVYTISVNSLRTFITGQDINLLVEPDPRQFGPPQVIIPIMVGTEVRSSTTLRFRPGAPSGTWVTANWGQPKLIRRLMSTYQTVLASLPAGTLAFAVEIPLFDLWFVGYHDPQNQLILRSTSELPLGPITIHQHEIITEAAIERLAFEAQRYNGFPN